MNNAGFGGVSPIEDADYEELEGTINLNIGPYVYLTRALLPRMLQREKRSGIIFNASIAAEFFTPCLAPYCGSKAFVDQFAKSLAYENVEKIDVLSYKPNLVESNMVKLKPNFNVLTAIEAANSALDKLGWDVETEGHWRHVYLNSKIKTMMTLFPLKKSMEMTNKRMRGFAKQAKAAKKT